MDFLALLQDDSTADLGRTLGGGLLVFCTAFGLAASCGLRVFLPLFLAGLAAKLEWLGLHEQFGWLGSTTALVVLAIASLLEIGSYHVPVLDNALDAVAVPAAAIAGAVVSLAVLEDTEPWLRWSLAVIAGSGLATTVKIPIAGVRAASTVATAGVGNQVVSFTESAAATAMSFLAVLLPLAVVPLFLAFVLGAFFLWRRLRRGKGGGEPVDSPA